MLWIEALVHKLGKIIGDVKGSVFTGDNSSIKNLETCTRCQYYVNCIELKKIDEIDEKMKSSIVLVDQGIEKVLKQKNWN